MTKWVEKLVVPLILMIIGGIGTVGWQYLTSPEAGFVSAQVRWVTVPNPIYGLDRRLVGDIEKSISAATGFGLVLGKFNFEREARVAVISVHNISNVRSKEIEIIAKQDSVLFSRDAVDTAKSLVKKVILKPLDPLASSEVYGIIGGWPYDVNESISAIYDNKRLQILGGEKHDDLGSTLAAIVANFPIISSIGMLIGAMSLFVMVLAIPLNVAQALSPRLKVKWTNDAQALAAADLLESIEAQQPGRLSKIKAERADKLTKSSSSG